jgi:hypothetical protein
MAEQNLTVADFVAEAETVICGIDPELDYNRADLYGFVSAAWPYDGTPADAACEFANALKAQQDAVEGE